MKNGALHRAAPDSDAKHTTSRSHGNGGPGPGWKKDQRILKLVALPAWGNWQADEVRRRDVRALLDRNARQAPDKANRTLEVVRKMFNWAVEEEIIEANPCWQVRRPTQERLRERLLSADEIRAWS